MDLETAQSHLNKIFKAKVGRELRKPEKIVLVGSWQGMTYEQMANSSAYSANYLMRDIAPKFWKTLSSVLGENIGKSNFRLKLCALYDVPKTDLDISIEQNNRAKKDSHSWRNAISLPLFYYGRAGELSKLQQEVIDRNCQLLKIWGLSGTGKTLLMKSLGEQIQAEYEVGIWRNLATAPKLTELLDDILRSEFGIAERDPSQLLSRLMAMMQSHSCLIMLDGVEAILQTKTLAGRYLSGYEDYDEFFELVGKSSHKSCMLVTSLENFGQTRSSSDSSVYNYKLEGLSHSEAKSLLKAENLEISSSQESSIDYYQGNPAILMIVAQIIHDLFNSNVREFFEQKSLVMGNIAKLLDKSFDRLSTLEIEILYWLASESKPRSLSEIQQEIPLSIYPVELIEALKSLVGRSLIETTQIEERSVFVLTPMMREFVTNKFIAQIGDNFSLASRLNWTDNITINLGRSTPKPTCLSQWLQNRFESGWQPVETLFTASRRSPARLRSAFNFRGEGVIKRFKHIDLDSESAVSVLLLIAISQDESAFKICVQAQPEFQEQTLPANLKLNLLDSSNTVLATIQSQAQDNFIQLPYFKGVNDEKFKLSLNLDSYEYREEFVI